MRRPKTKQASEAQRAVEAMLDESFFRVRAERVTELQYLRAMAELGPGEQAAGDVAAVMGRTSDQLGPTRARLIDKGLLGLDMTAENLLSPGQHPGIEVSVETGLAQVLASSPTRDDAAHATVGLAEVAFREGAPREVIDLLAPLLSRDDKVSAELLDWGCDRLGPTYAQIGKHEQSLAALQRGLEAARARDDESGRLRFSTLPAGKSGPRSYTYLGYDDGSKRWWGP